ncbi:XRE family transcriptional regulator [Treponema ruminis]|uniref:Transcriptional regulator with XRE-family HTH domain n=1 Tax=Treponema ruminis TaxID=744515 RepID=A0A7W8LLA2_9SPIR|nr:helix-turn-helix transcriptional regulator [Treponema ruminis]MBB5225140.1 transcriptional regulator with XRE-family HTH domain [Treponema ruminis]QSI01061.1 XRE family transcriptional regulator [Treponema ruminis]
MNSFAIREIFANNLRFFRKSHNPPFTQEKLSELVGKNQNYIGLIEKGKSSPPLEMIALIAEKLEIEPSLLLEEKASLDNLKSFNKEDLITELSSKIVANLQSSITNEIRNALK